MRMWVRDAFRLAALMALTGTLLLATVAFAQVPPHVPGSICFTPRFWCWAMQPGPPGYQCACATPYGFVPGTLG
jgi:hypothetical protein